MTIRYYDSHGNWIAFRRNEDHKYVFDTDSNWIGWLPRIEEDEVWSCTTHEYLGTIVGDRLLKKTRPRSRSMPSMPAAPAAPAIRATPATRATISMPSGYTDI